MDEFIERVTRLETQNEAIRADIAEIKLVLDKSESYGRKIATQLASLLATSRTWHTPENCPYRSDIRECREALWFARGGGKVVLWLLGGGLLSLGAVIGMLARL